jgi:hypothetical protein
MTRLRRRTVDYWTAVSCRAKVERQLAARSAAVNPLRLKLELESAQRTLAERGVHPVTAHPLRSEEL